jgi:hypothetical protein
MLPISQIEVGDQFQNPMFRDGNINVVMEVDTGERMVKIQSYGFKDGSPIMKPFWVKNTHQMFQESWRTWRNL